ncbi:hypothetical protein L1887_28930 [Cichorium endivia]|nr:hypothetical protein L1887_28930 [Cichorium endivia]
MQNLFICQICRLAMKCDCVEEAERKIVQELKIKNAKCHSSLLQTQLQELQRVFGMMVQDPRAIDLKWLREQS